MTRRTTTGCGCDTAQELAAIADRDQRRVLIAVLAINVALFIGEFGAGVWAASTALQADSLDSLGDAGVYALSLFVVGRTLRWRAGAAVVKGLFQGLFGIFVLSEVVQKALIGVTPDAPIMIVAAAIAFAGNLICFVLLTRFRHQDINFRSVWLCSRNDLASNLGVVVAAAAVAWLEQGWPDLLVGALVAALFLITSFDVLRTAIRQLREPEAGPVVRCTSRMGGGE
jgi:Co/Zn/Cd efflux system component